MAIVSHIYIFSHRVLVAFTHYNFPLNSIKHCSRALFSENTQFFFTRKTSDFWNELFFSFFFFFCTVADSPITQPKLDRFFFFFRFCCATQVVNYTQYVEYTSIEAKKKWGKPIFSTQGRNTQHAPCFCFATFFFRFIKSQLRS